MKILNKEKLDDENILRKLKESVFIYPTDTIYGIGCNALDSKLVQKIREIKKRQSQPFSVIAPNKEWIYKNCEVDDNAENWIKKLPGPYTLILKIKNKKSVAENVSISETLGVRMPNHWFLKVVEKLGIPVVTTSVNLTGEAFMTSLENLPEEIKNKVDYIIYEGEKKARPSEIVDLSYKRIKIIKR